MNGLQDAYIVAAQRTAIGRFRGSLSTVRPDDLAAHLIQNLSQNYSELPIDHVILGAANQAGEDNRNVARMASLLAGLPYEVPAVTVNRLCGSGLEAVADAAMRIWTHNAEVVIAGGVENMTRAPYVLAKANEPFSRTPPIIYDTMLGYRFENEMMQKRFPLQPLGETAENVAEKWKITRQEQDRYAFHSQQKAAAAVAGGSFDEEIIPVSIKNKKGSTLFAKDEAPRADTTLERLAELNPVFKKNGTVTAGNSSPINDGASVVLVVSHAALKQYQLEPLAKIRGFATAGVDPNLMGEGPIGACQKLFSQHGYQPNDIDLIELNEAFASQTLACIGALGLDPLRVNVDGGAIALGHPVSASGCRILVTLIHAMRRRGARRGVATLCIGMGQGIAMLIER